MATIDVATMRDGMLSYALREYALAISDETSAGLLNVAAQRIDNLSDRVATLSAENEGLRVKPAPRKRKASKPKPNANVAWLLKAKFASVGPARSDGAMLQAWRGMMEEQRGPIHGPVNGRETEHGFVVSRRPEHEPVLPDRSTPLLVHGSTVIHDERAARTYVREIGKH